jgi:nucleotide-binding universal stress UspA family protein
MFNKILIAIDDSQPAQYAIQVGVAIAREDKSSVIFGVALDPTLLSQECSFTSVRELAEQIANDVIAGATKEAEADGVTACSKTLFDDPTRGILELAAREDVGLIAIGTHARTGLSAALSRSIADEVLRKTIKPLCVVRRPRIGKIYHRLLVPVADDDLSRAGAEFATEVAKSFGSTLLFCTVPNGSNGKTSEQLLDGMVAHAGTHGVKAEAFILKRDGAISGTIAKCAKAQESDAIVMATHGREGLPRLFEGSVTEAVIRSSDIPVVVVRPERVTLRD